jgi:protein-disulfide isomerase
VATVLVVVALIAFNLPGSDVNDDPYVLSDGGVERPRVEGNPDAPVRILEFSDFQCPFCRRFTFETAPALREEFVETGVVTIEYRHLVVLGEESLRAAEAAECAGVQGAFWEFHDLLFLRQGAEFSGTFSSGNLKGFARELAAALAPFDRPFDLDLFDACLDGGGARVIIEAQTAEARSLGLSNTPSFLVGNVLVSGAQPVEVFRRAIAQAQGSE